MNAKIFSAMMVGAVMAALFSAQAGLAAAPAPYRAPTNAYGQPDLEGTWTNATLTPLVRAKEYGTPAKP